MAKTRTREIDGRYLNHKIKVAEELANSTNNPVQFLLLGDLQGLKGEREQQDLSYRKALKIGGVDAEAHAKIAEVSLVAGNIHSAIEHYEEAIKKNPSMFSAYMPLATAYKLSGNEGKEKETYKKYLDAQLSVKTMLPRKLD